MNMHRYSRQLPLIGKSGQEKLARAKILVIGAGGLGCPALQYLVSAGIGTIGIMDGDNVELTNLQRQILFTENDIDKSKAEIAQQKLLLLNTQTKITILPEFINKNNINIIKNYDLILDGSDNYQTKYLLNDYCVEYNKPLVSASVLQWQGQMSIFNLNNGPCYRCLYPTPPPSELTPNCSQAGTLGPIAGTLGSIQALETIKIILNKKNLTNNLLVFDGVDLNFKKYKINKNPDCPCCVKKLKSDSLFKLNIKEINYSELKSKIKNNKINLIDVREDYERQQGHIGGTHIPFTKFNINNLNLDKNSMIIVYCAAGVRSAHIVKLLDEAGFTQAYNLSGGLFAISHQGQSHQSCHQEGQI